MKKIIAANIFIILGLGLVAITVSLSSNQPAPTHKSTANVKKTYNQVTIRDPKPKLACDLLHTALVTKTIGAGAVKNETLPANGTKDYSSTSCEYAVGGAAGKKATVTLYKYQTAKKAQADKTNVETSQLVFDQTHKQVVTQPKSSVGAVKGVYVITATVTSGGKYDPEASKQLAQEVINQL